MKRHNKTLHPTAGNVLLSFQASFSAVDELDVRKKMKKSKYQLAQERNRLRSEAERDKDMVYFVKFQKKDCGYPLQFFPIVDQLSSDPTQNPATLERAIKTFEAREKVADWREIADSYECGKYWYG